MGLSKPKNVLSGDGLEMELLWENASLESDFPAQKINLDLSKYDMVHIETMNAFVWGSGSNLGGDFLIPIGKGCYCGSVMNQIIYTRHAGVYPDGIDFSIGKEWQYGANSNNLREDAKVAVPVRIFGVKGVKTA